MWRALFLVAGLTALPAATRADPQAAPLVAGSLAYYPPAARAAGVEGEATIRCTRTPRAALRACTLVSETPTGQQFGAAALALAAQTTGNPKVNVQDPRFLQPLDVTIQFHLNPPSVRPDLTFMPHVVTQPDILSPPTAADVARAYPEAARKAHVGGHVTLNCRVTADGSLTACAVTEETPADQQFGAAALRLAMKFRMKPQLLDGEPHSGAQVNLPIGFVPG